MNEGIAKALRRAGTVALGRETKDLWRRLNHRQRGEWRRMLPRTRAQKRKALRDRFEHGFFPARILRAVADGTITVQLHARAMAEKSE